jgi:2-isopropylmalate synthase
MEKKLRMTPEQVFEQAKQAVRFARNLCADIEFSPRGRLPLRPDFLCRVLEAVIAEGRHHHQHARHRRLRVPELYGEFIRRPCASACAQQRQGDLVACTATTTWAWRWPTRWPA